MPKDEKMNHLPSLGDKRVGESFKLLLEVMYGTYCSSKVYIQKLLFRPDSKRRKVNLGGGNQYKRYWENVDLYANSVYIEYKINFLNVQLLPFENESVEKIFSSHLLEHLPDDAVLNLLKECERCLKVGGRLRISVPDMDKAFKAYLESNWDFF